MEKVLRKLQSGSDIRGIAIQHEDKQVTLNRDTVAVLAQGYVNYISKKLGKNPEKIVVSAGTDPRITGGKLQCAFSEELLDATDALSQAYQQGTAERATYGIMLAVLLVLVAGWPWAAFHSRSNSL